MKALDLFCGLGGWSDGLALEGFDVLGVEINPEIATLYKHKVMVQDVLNLEKLLNFYRTKFNNYDLIVGSPPCRDFTQLPDTRWKEPKKTDRGLILIHAFLRIVKKLKPKYWLMENVVGLTEYLNIKPQCIVRLTSGKRRALWGNFSPFLIPRDYSHPKHMNIHGKHRAWIRAKIPLPTARALGKTVKEQLC